MSQQDVDTMRRAYDGFGRQDVEAVLAAFDADIDFHSSDVIPRGGQRRGHQEVTAFFGSLASTFEELEVAPDEFVDAGDRVIVLGIHRGRANGQRFETPFVQVWRMRGGKAVAMKEYLDPSQLLKAVGWQAPAGVGASV
jgi:uncharacterized protein